MKKGWMLALIALSVISCQKGEQASIDLSPSRFTINPNEPSYKLQDEEGVITWYINYDWYPNSGIGEDLVTQKIFKDTKTKIHIMKGNDDRLHQMIAAGDMPDIITMDATLALAKTANRWVVPLNNLADAYDPYFYQVAKRDTLAWYTDNHGNIYGYPNFSNDANDFLAEDSVMIGREGFLVRQDIYRAISMPDMRTPEGFLQALRDAKTYDPTITPLVIESLGQGGAVVEVLMNFLAIPTLKNDQYYERMFDEEYLIWMDTLRQAYQESLIKADNFTYNHNDRLYEEDLENGRAFATLAYSLAGTSWPIIRNAHRNEAQGYIAIDGPANQAMHAPKLSQAGISGWTLSFVSQTSPHKERAMQLITYLLSKEGQLTIMLGEEGTTYYQSEDGLYRFYPEIEVLRNTNADKYQKEFNLGTLWMLQDENIYLRYSDIFALEMRPIWQWTRGKQAPQFALENSDPEPRSAEEKSWLGYIQERNDTATRMLRASSYQEMQAELDALKRLYESDGVQRAIAVKNEKIAQNVEKLTTMGYAQEG